MTVPAFTFEMTYVKPEFTSAVIMEHKERIDGNQDFSEECGVETLRKDRGTDTSCTSTCTSYSGTDSL